MNRFLQKLREQLPEWAHEWLEVIVPAIQVAMIFLGAWLIYRVARRIVRHLSKVYGLPNEVTVVSNRTAGVLIYGSAFLWSLERIGVSSTALWTAFTGFAAVGAVAIFAVWSVLSNAFCALLIFSTRIFRAGDLIEVLENGEKPGLKGRVLDINLVYTTLSESGNAEAGTALQVPNSLFFQRAVRRWHGPLSTLPARPTQPKVVAESKAVAE